MKELKKQLSHLSKYPEEVHDVEEVEIRDVENGGEKDRVYIYHIDDDGRNFSTTSGTVNRKAVLLLSRHLDRQMTPAEIYQEEPRKQEELLNEALDNYGEPLKFIFTKDEKDIAAITSAQHKQIDKREVVKAMINAAQEESLTPEDVKVAGDRYYSFKLAKSDTAELWSFVDTGKNIPVGKSAIHFQARLRFHGDYGGFSGCHNWAFWQQTAKFMEVNLTHLKTEIRDRLPDLPELSMREVHLKKTEISAKLFKEKFEGVRKAVDEADKVVKNASKVKIRELQGVATLEAYFETLDMPRYLRKQLRQEWHKNEDRTLAGLSQSISWVRTHGKVITRTDRGTRETQLEKMAGELITIAPAIKKIKDKGGLQKNVLLGKKDPPHAILA